MRSENMNVGLVDIMIMTMNNNDNNMGDVSLTACKHL